MQCGLGLPRHGVLLQTCGEGEGAPLVLQLLVNCRECGVGYFPWRRPFALHTPHTHELLRVPQGVSH